MTERCTNCSRVLVMGLEQYFVCECQRGTEAKEVEELPEKYFISEVDTKARLEQVLAIISEDTVMHEVMGETLMDHLRRGNAHYIWVVRGKLTHYCHPRFAEEYYTEHPKFNFKEWKKMLDK